MVPRENLPSSQSRTRVIGALRAVSRFFFHTLGVRFLLALVSAFALWWYVIPDGSGNVGNTAGLGTGSYRTVAVVSPLHGTPADGYAVTSVLIAPPTITIQGTVPGVGDTTSNSINTEPIDITDANRTLTRVVGLELPLGVSSTTVS